MPIRTALSMLSIFMLLAAAVHAAGPDTSLCTQRSTLHLVQGSCGSCVWQGTTYSCETCSAPKVKEGSASIDITSCASCDLAVASGPTGDAALYCAELKVGFTMKNRLRDPSKATIANTIQHKIKTLVPLEYTFEIGDERYRSDQVTSGEGQKITYFLGEAFRSAGYRFKGIVLLWKPPGAEGPAASTCHNGHTITLTDEGAKAGGYVFLFELTNDNDTGDRAGTVYRSPDPTLYNPPDTSPGG
ncbi:MAG: hypothetical protein AAGN66_14260 [Acidobacteriota bacterium]